MCILRNRDLDMIAPESAAQKPSFGLAIRPMREILAVNEHHQRSKASPLDGDVRRKAVVELMPSRHDTTRTRAAHDHLDRYSGQYFNSVVEQDHRRVETAFFGRWRITISGVELLKLTDTETQCDI